MLAALGAEEVLQAACGITERAHAVQDIRLSADASVAVAAANVGSREPFSLLDGTAFQSDDIQDQLPAIADAVRSGAMSIRELATLLITAAQASRVSLHNLTDDDRLGLPALHAELLSAEPSIDRVTAIMSPQEMLSQLASAAYCSRKYKQASTSWRWFSPSTTVV